MKKVFAFMLAVMLMLAAAVNVGATDAVDEPMTEAVTEAAETLTEAQKETAEEVETETNTEAETSPIEADSELGALLDGATPEQIENIKQYILYGISTLPLPDQVRVFAAENLNAIAWIVAGITFLLFFIGNRMTKKSLADTMTITNNNAVEVAEMAQDCVEKATASMGNTAADVANAMRYAEEKCAQILEEAKTCTEEVTKALEERSSAMLSEAKESHDAAVKAMAELKARESGLTEAEIVMATVLCDLVQSSSLPEWKKDEFTVHLNEGLSKIKEVTSHDEA